MAYEKYYKDFKKYELVRRSGMYNMITEAPAAMKAAKLSDRKYRDIIHKYSFIKHELEEEYGSIDEYLKKQAGGAGMYDLSTLVIKCGLLKL